MEIIVHYSTRQYSFSLPICISMHDIYVSIYSFRNIQETSPNSLSKYCDLLFHWNRVFKLCICACMCGGSCVPQCTCGSQRTKCESWVTPSLMWVTEVEFRSSSLVASVFTCRAIFLALTNRFLKKFIFGNYREIKI